MIAKKTKTHGALMPFALAAPLAIGCHGALVGGECLEGFEERDGACVLEAADGGSGGASTATSNPTSTSTSNPTETSSSSSTSTTDATASSTTTTTSTTDATASSASTAEGSSSTGVIECAPLTYCAPTCVDLENDPDNCGGCGHYCPSGLCTDGACEGAPGGHAVFAGFDYGHAQQAMPRAILKNALTLSARNPLRVADACSPDAGQVCDTVRALLVQTATDAGKAITLSPRTLLEIAQAPQVLTDIDVLVVHHTMRDEIIQADGTSPLDPLLGGFAGSGRTVIVLGDATYVDGLSELMLRSSLLPIDGAATTAGSASVVDFFDALASGVISPFAQSGAATALDLSDVPDPLVRAIATNDAGAVLVHRVFPPSP